MVNSRGILHRKLRERLGGLVTGPVLGADDPAYEESRRVFNAMIERRPAVILQCSGLACDNVLSMDVVTADGQVRTANAGQHQDLYWGLRGGGGNFGAVVSFTYRLTSIKAAYDPENLFRLNQNIQPAGARGA